MLRARTKTGRVAGGLSGNYSTSYALTQLRDGQLHAMPQSYDVDFDIRGLKVQFGNLFNGNKLLGEPENTTAAIFPFLTVSLDTILR